MLPADSWKTNKQLKDGVKAGGKNSHHLPPAFLRRGSHTVGTNEFWGRKQQPPERRKPPPAEHSDDPAQRRCRQWHLSKVTSGSLQLRARRAKHPCASQRALLPSAPKPRHTGIPLTQAPGKAWPHSTKSCLQPQRIHNTYINQATEERLDVGSTWGVSP